MLLHIWYNVCFGILIYVTKYFSSEVFDMYLNSTYLFKIHKLYILEFFFADISEYAKSIGIDPIFEDDLLFIARIGICDLARNHGWEPK